MNYAATLSVVLLLVISGLGLVVDSNRTGGQPLCSTMPSVFMQEFCQHIDHVVVIFMENHAYDNYFATYCLVKGPYCTETAIGVSPGTCLPQVGYTGNSSYPTGKPVCPEGSIAPWNFTAENLSTIDVAHGEANTVRSICGTTANASCLGQAPKMTGFWNGEGKTYTVFGHYNGTTIPVYWDMAEEFGLGDGFFSSDPSYSLPNHWFMIAGQAPPQSQTYLTTVPEQHHYIDEANVTNTVQDLLNNTPQVSWKYYDWTLAPYNQAIATTGGPLPSNQPGNGSAYSLWNPMAGRNESYRPAEAAHFVNRTQFFTSLSGTLPNVSWVIPQGGYSDHPPANITKGQSFVAQYVDAIEESKYWNSTAVFVTWDDYGGFFDHVGPPGKTPTMNPLGLSIRVPLIVISPYTPAGLVSAQVGYFDSILATIEQRWNLGCVVPGRTQDCTAPVMSSYFDFGLTPRSPCLFPTNASLASYPDTTCALPRSAAQITPSLWTGSDEGLNDTEAD